MSFRKPEKFFGETIMSALSAAILRIPNAEKIIPQHIDVTPKTVENWIEGTAKPNADNLIDLMREFDEVTDEVLRLAGKRVMTTRQLEAAKQALKILEGQ